MPPNKTQLATLVQRLSEHDLSQLLNNNYDDKPNVIEISSSSSNRGNKTQRLPLQVEAQQDPNYWYWSNDNTKAQEALETTRIEANLLKEAGRLKEQVRQQHSQEYWTWESPAQVNAQQAQQEQQDQYWAWKEDVKDEDVEMTDVLRTDHIISNLKNSSNDHSVPDKSSSLQNADYWSFEPSKQRLNRLQKERKMKEPQHNISIDQSLVNASSEQRTLNSNDSYWNWDARYMSQTAREKFANNKENVLGTDATVDRLVQDSKNKDADYWSWNPKNVVSGAAIEKNLIAERNSKASDSYWAWEGAQSSFEVSNNIIACRTHKSVEPSLQYWVM